MSDNVEYKISASLFSEFYIDDLEKSIRVQSGLNTDIDYKGAFDLYSKLAKEAVELLNKLGKKDKFKHGYIYYKEPFTSAISFDIALENGEYKVTRERRLECTLVSEFYPNNTNQVIWDDRVIFEETI